MKTRAQGLALCTLGSILILPLFACTSGKSPRGAIDVRPRFEELTTGVPENFTDARKWNQTQLCPEGSVLTPFTRYEYEPGQDSHGFKYYYGRSCAIIQTEELEASRKLASVETAPDAKVPAKVQTPEAFGWTPHGPFIWWYESGKRMETGTFDHGTLALGHTQYQPDGSPIAKE